MFKRIDYIIISVVIFFVSILIVAQFSSTKNYLKIIEPENNAALAVEVSRLTKANADLRVEVKALTDSLDQYKASTNSRQSAYDQYLKESKRYDVINGLSLVEGQGVTVTEEGKLSLPAVVDLVNAIKNIGGESIAINDQRITLNTNLNQFVNRGSIQVKVVGNSKLLTSALERKGGIIEQISSKDISFSIKSEDSLAIPATTNDFRFHYAKIIEN